MHAAASFHNHVARVELRVARCCFSKTIRRDAFENEKEQQLVLIYRDARAADGWVTCAGRRLEKGSDFSGAIFFPDP
jgi:hypothetical protein